MKIDKYVNQVGSQRLQFENFVEQRMNDATEENGVEHFSRFNFPAAGNENGGVWNQGKKRKKATWLTKISVDVAAHYFNFVKSTN